MDISRVPWKHIAIIILELAFGANIIFLDVLIAQKLNNPPQAAKTTTQNEIVSPTCDNGICNGPTPVPTAALNIPTPIPPVTSAPAPAAVAKEYFVPFGQGQTTATSWTDVPGLLAYVDSTKYPNISSVIFEVSVNVPNGNQTAWIRLYNKTDGRAVFNSEMSWSGGGEQFLTSQPLTMDFGNKLYSVQMKTQLGSLTNLDSSRLHITLN